VNPTTDSILNDLIETSRDGEEGFNRSFADTTNEELRAVFGAAARHCRESAHELEALLSPPSAGSDKLHSVAAAVHRGWASVKEVMTGRDDVAILDECERAEDYAKARYRRALDQELPYAIREVVERQYRGVIANHDRVRALRDSYRAHAEVR
jgi:uncharacterized protein (TIGR02284 family)